MILLDAANTKYRFQTVSRRAVISVLEQLEPSERVAIYALGSRFRTIHGFSSDKESLLARLRAYHGEVPDSDNLLYDFDLDMGAADPLSVDVIERDIFDSNRIVDTFGALEAIANAMKGVSGRKNLIWVSQSFPVTTGTPTGRVVVRNFEPEMKRAMRALNDANISVYPVHARGLSVASVAGGADLRNLATTVEWSEVSTILSVAAATGGKAFYNNSDLGRGVRAALDDSRVVYMLTYSPELPAADGAYHRIRVQTSRHGVRVRYRPGYYAPGKPGATAAEEADRLAELVRSPRDLPGIGMQGVIEPVPGRAGEVGVLVRVNAADLNLVHDVDAWSGEIRLGAMQLGAGGELLGGARDSGEVRLEQTAYRRALENGLLFRLKFQRNPAAVAVRVAIVEERGGQAGSMQLTLLPVPGAATKTTRP
jgi:VWFA-related protein